MLPVHAMKVYRGRKSTASLILKPCADINFTSQPLSHRVKKAPITPGRGVQVTPRAGLDVLGKEKKYLPHARN